MGSMRRRLFPFGLLAASLTLATAVTACGEDPPAPVTPSACDGQTVDTYAPGMTKPSEGGHFTVVLVESTMVPPDRGDNRFKLRVVDSAGNAVPDATVVVRPWMPNHGHGSTPESFTPIATGNPGELEVGPINFFMPGLWELRVTVSSVAMDASERATFAFCVEG